MAGSLQTGEWPGFVARIATPSTPEEIARNLADGYPAAIGGEIPPGVLAATCAQIELETGTRVDPNHDGTTTPDEQAAGYWNGNAGNVRGTYQGFWTSFRAGEGYGTGAVTLEPGPMNRFRSYVTATDDITDPATIAKAKILGVLDFLAVLNRQWPKALYAAGRADFHGYVQALRDGGYFTANAESYWHAEEALRKTLSAVPTMIAYHAGGL